MILATYVSTTEFTVTGDRESEYPFGRKITAYQGVDGTAENYAYETSYDSGTDLTTVTLASACLTSNLVAVRAGVGNKNSLGIHFHTGSDDAGSLIQEDPQEGDAVYFGGGRWRAVVRDQVEGDTMRIIQGAPRWWNDSKTTTTTTTTTSTTTTTTTTTSTSSTTTTTTT